MSEGDVIKIIGGVLVAAALWWFQTWFRASQEMQQQLGEVRQDIALLQQEMESLHAKIEAQAAAPWVRGPRRPGGG